MEKAFIKAGFALSEPDFCKLRAWFRANERDKRFNYLTFFRQGCYIEEKLLKSKNFALASHI